MIFNQQGRSEAVDFFESIHAAVKRAKKPAFDHVIFCTNMTFAKSGYKREFVNHQFDAGEIKSMTVQKRFAEKWSSVDPLAKVSLIPTIEQAIDFTKRLQGDDEQQVHVFVTGSLHLVGGVLGILEQTDAL
jgi:folylpolyglutamate synthase